MKKDTLLFVIFLAGIALLYNYPFILGSRPYSTHQWRQADCLSFADNYYNNGLKFFEPAVNWIGTEGNGKTVSEFPIIYYIVAILWKVFGKHESIFRCINLLIVFTGLYYLFLLSKEILKDRFWSLFVPFFLFASPVYVYYANNFLSDAPALSIVFIAWYYIFKSCKERKNKWLYVAAGLFALSGLLKITSLLSCISLIIVFIILKIEGWKNQTTNLLLPKNKHILFSILIIFIVIGSWHVFSTNYNEQHNRGLFLQRILPIWDLEKGKIKEIILKLYNEIFPLFFNLTGLHIILLLFVYGIINYKKNNRFSIYLMTIIFIGSLIYMLLFFQQFNVHDYYLINMLIIIPITIIVFLNFIRENNKIFFESKPFKIVSLILLLCSLYYTAVNTRIMYNSGDRFVKNSFIIVKTQQDYWNWYHWQYNEHYKALETITPYLRSLGIKRQDKVISIPDQSINISLYLMDQTGFTDFGYGDFQDSLGLNYFKSIGAKYIIVNNKSVYDNNNLAEFFKNKIGSYKNVDIFKL